MISSVKGMKDVLPDEVLAWQECEEVFRSITKSYSYDEIRTPVLEYDELFRKGTGDQSTVVNKEMYSFLDKGGDTLCLRPELTPAVARAVLSANLLRSSQVLRLWYYGPCFRYERPQLGRQRQFHQMGAECLGTRNPESDAEVISLLHSVIRHCDVQSYKLLINTLGERDSRGRYLQTLKNFFLENVDSLGDDSKKRVENNPLRILDSKDEKDRAVVQNAPVILDFLDAADTAHFNELCTILQSLGIPYEIDPRLVRGLDYYTQTVFEFRTDKLGTQDAIGGGGRYNNLFETLSGPQTPGVGFAMGVERLLLLREQELITKATKRGVCLVSDSQTMVQSMVLADNLRQLGHKVSVDLARRSFKSQLREADKKGFRFVIFIGTEELRSSTVVLKELSSGKQELIAMGPKMIAKTISTM